MENLNTPKYLDEMRTEVLSILDEVQPHGSQIHTGQIGTTQIPGHIPVKVQQVSMSDDA